MVRHKGWTISAKGEKYYTKILYRNISKDDQKAQSHSSNPLSQIARETVSFEVKCKVMMRSVQTVFSCCRTVETRGAELVMGHAWAAEVPACGSAPCVLPASSYQRTAAAWAAVEKSRGTTINRFPGSAVTARHPEVNEDTPTHTPTNKASFFCS